MWLRTLAQGYLPYRQVYITYPPLYPLAIEAVWRMWPTEDVQRWFSVVYAIFGVLGVVLIARKFAGPVAGLGAAALLLFSPVLMTPSVSILGEFPSVAWSVWAVWLAWLYRDAHRRRTLLAVLSGLCLSASLLTKLLSPFLVALIPLMLLTSRPPDWPADQPYRPAGRWWVEWSALKPRLIDLIWWGLALLLPALALLAVYDVGALVQQVVGQRLEARTVYLADQTFWAPRLERATQFVQEDALLVLLALTGLGVAWWRRLKDFWIILAWLGLALIMLAIHDPIRYKHFLILMPPFAILGGVALSGLVRFVCSTFSVPAAGQKPPPAAKVAAGALLALLLALLIWQAQSARALWQANAAVPQPPTDEVEALAFIDSVTAPDDCLITDDMPLVYWSGRPVPPELAEVSTNRLKSGALTLAELVNITDKYDCQLVAAVSNRIPQYLPNYMEWVKLKYLGRFHYGEDDLYFAKVDTDPNPAMPLWADFSGQFIFHGYGLPATPVAPGERVPLTLVWQAQTQPATDYTIFVQLRDANQNILASADHQPYNWLVPTSKWPAGAVIQETSWLELPPDIPPGAYNIYVGLYRADTLERLPITNDTSGENALVLGPLLVR